MAAILSDARPVAVLGESIEAVAALVGARALTPDSLARRRGSLPPLPSPEALAVVQYSSGSTRVPIGIAITHGNIAAEERMLEIATKEDERTVGVSWLPPFHDMGLFATILLPLFLGGTAVLMPPMAFLQKPLRWLRAISRYGGSLAGAPNFAFDLCVRRVTMDAAADLDLRSWAIAFCGAEPVRAATLRRFEEHFAVAGFDRQVLLPAYGLAEATLAVTITPLKTGWRELELSDRSVGGEPRSHVSCGPPMVGSSLLLRRDDGELSASGPGEVCVSGPHVSPGLWSGETRSVVAHPTLFTGPDGKPYLPTGDVGALVDGELAIVGRLKDVIVLHGRKLHALDVEKSVLEALPDDATAAAAFAVQRGDREVLVLLLEVGARIMPTLDVRAYLERVRALVGECHGIVPEVGVLPHGALPRTSSGKIQRGKARGLFGEGRLRLVAFTEDRTEVA